MGKKMKRALAGALCMSLLLGNTVYAMDGHNGETEEVLDIQGEVAGEPENLELRFSDEELWTGKELEIDIDAENALYFELFVLDAETEEEIFYLKTEEAGTYRWLMEQEGNYTIFFRAVNENGISESKKYNIQVLNSSGVWCQIGSKWKYQLPDKTYAVNTILEIDGRYYSFDAHGYMETGWKNNDGKWYYYTSWGACVDEWRFINGSYYHFDKDAVMETGWLVIDEKQYYLSPSGAMASGWSKIDGTWFYFNGLGEMQTGWVLVGGAWYYLDTNGAMQTGWQNIDGIWYFLYNSGEMKTGWLKYGGTWYYFKGSGAMATKWELVGSKWYLFDENGAMKTGWQQIDGDWFFLSSSGDMQTGWIGAGNTWYYLSGWGSMVTGWQYIDGYKYFFDASGVMDTDLRDVIPGPYHIKVNRSQNCVTVYAQEGPNKYAIPVVAFLCSTGGSKTPLGTFTMSTQYRWHQLYGAAGQYCSRITGHILFHSVPYSRMGDIYSLMPGQFNRLGSNASAGCVRLATGDAKWIYDNCYTGVTEVTIYDGGSSSPLGRPVLPQIPYYQNWDPTDPAIYQ